MNLIYVEGELTRNEEDTYLQKVIPADNIESFYVSDFERNFFGVSKSYNAVIIETKSGHKYIFVSSDGRDYYVPETDAEGKTIPGAFMKNIEMKNEFIWECYNRLAAALSHPFTEGEILKGDINCTDQTEIEPCCKTPFTGNGIPGSIIHYLFDSTTDGCSHGCEGPTLQTLNDLHHDGGNGINIKHFKTVVENVGWNLKEDKRVLEGYLKIPNPTDSDRERMKDLEREIAMLTKRYRQAVYSHNFLQKTLNNYTGRPKTEFLIEEDERLLSPIQPPEPEA